ncbi:hypothetical protein IW18_20025 [Flavobacterium hibernum]|uniref:Lipoprotein n=2 Tax=Flavobacterium hibernum TaxID=37752 RepID=A0A0D0EZG1_9FLAO|nr:hypothetical protein IW18_20025 [Flavobacterium hibernum]OXA86162.1 hypothetical protein B0A73_15035 [Flavobacterium hibernum]STO14588.1 Uncharacterised protein [Flavobacterium hibernum]
MKKILFILFLLCSLISCERKEPNFSKKMIEKLAYMYEDVELGLLPSEYLRLDLYIFTNDKEICRTNNHDLFTYYRKNYFKKFASFEIFLDEVLNREFLLDENSKSFYSFKLNQKIQKEYVSLGFDNFLKKYSEDNVGKEKLKLNTSIIQKNDLSTIKYLLYKNKYDVGFDDHLATYYIQKREDSFR